MAEGNDLDISKVQLDSFENFVAVPTHKLDADQYSAEDLDGVTESLFGSGNMAYASLQASQTDAVLNIADPITGAGNAGFDFLNNNDSSFRIAPDIDAQSAPADAPVRAGENDDLITDTDRGIESQGQFNAPNDTGSGNFASSTVGAVSASELSSNQGTFAPSGSGLSLQEGLNGTNGQDGETPDVPDIPAPTDGTDGADGVDGTGGDTNIEVNLGDVNLDLGDLTEFLDQTFIELGDTINNLTTSVTEITEILGDVITNLDITNLLDLTEITNLINDLTINLNETINNTLINITNITNNVTNLIENILGGDGDLELTLDLNVLDTGLLDVTVPFSNLLDTDVNLDVNLDPTVNLINNIADLTGLDILSDTLAELGGTVNTLQNTIDQVTDLVTDLNLNDPGATVDQLIDTIGNLDQTVTDITQSVDGAVGGILDTLGVSDGDGSLGDTLDGVVGNIGDGLDGLTGGATGDITDGLEDAVDQVTDVVDALTDDALDGVGDTLEDAVDQITDVVDDLAGTLLGGDGETPLDDLADTIGDALGLGGDDNGDEGLISQTLDPVVGDVTDALDNVTGGATSDLSDGINDIVDGVSDLADNLTGGLTDGLLGQNNDNNGGQDTDVALDLGLGADGQEAIDETIEAALDPIEDLVGDIDLGIGTTLLGDGETDNNAGDSDLTIDTGIDLVDNTLLDEGLDAPLDPLEEITGDLDIDIDLAADLLGQQADGLVDNFDGGTGEDTVVADLGDGLGNLVGGILGGDSNQVENGAAQTVDASAGAIEESIEGIGSTLEEIGALADELGLEGGDNNGDEGLISQTLDPVAEDITDALDSVSGGATGDLGDTVNNVVDGASDLADNLTGGLTGGLLGENNDNADETDGDLNADIAAGIIETGIVDAPLEAALDPVEDLAGDLDIDLGAAANLLNNQGTDNESGDSDVTAGSDAEIVDTELLGGSGEVHLDAVEQLAGDVDADATVVTDILSDTADDILNSGNGGTGEDTLLSGLGDGLQDIAEDVVPGLNAGDSAEEDLSLDTNIDILDENLADTDVGSVLDPVEEIAGDIDTALGLNTDLLNNENTSNDSGDSDLVTDLDIDLAGQDVADIPLDVPLDMAEQLTGDIDLELDSAIDLLNSDSTENTDGSASGEGESSWTESTITDGGGLFGDIINGTDGLGDALPDPAGTVGEGIGVLDVDPELDVGSLGGLFG